MIAASPLSLEQKKNVLKEPRDVWEKEKIGFWIYFR